EQNEFEHSSHVNYPTAQKQKRVAGPEIITGTALREAFLACSAPVVYRVDIGEEADLRFFDPCVANSREPPAPRIFPTEAGAIRMSAETARGGSSDRGFFGHPRGLGVLFFTEAWERFSYYGMRAILLYYMYSRVEDGGLAIDEGSARPLMAASGASIYSAATARRGMRAILLYYMYSRVEDGGLAIDEGSARSLIAAYGASIYMAAIAGGWISDRLLGARRCTLIGGILIMLGHICLALPAGVAALA